MAARGAGAPHASPLSRPAGVGRNRAAVAGSGVLGLLQIRLSAGFGDLVTRPRPAPPTRRAVPGYAVDRRGPGILGVSRRRASPRPDRRSARPSAEQR